MTNAPSLAVKPRGLDPQRKYLVREVNLPDNQKSAMAADGQMIDGATLMSDGLVPPCCNEFGSATIELLAEKAN